MTKSQRSKFYTMLKEAAPHFTWKLTRSGKIRGLRSKHYYCPLTAIVNVKVKKRFPVWDAGFCALNNTNMSNHEINEVIRAADQGQGAACKTYDGKDATYMKWYDSNLRKQMLKILNLKP